MSTKDRILEEALTLFAENGYDGTGVEQIAEKVGIKAPSLYKHFKGKEDIRFFRAYWEAPREQGGVYTKYARENILYAP